MLLVMEGFGKYIKTNKQNNSINDIVGINLGNQFPLQHEMSEIKQILHSDLRWKSVIGHTNK